MNVQSPPTHKSKLASIAKSIKEFLIRHPAVLSGYIIYAYFFISTMDFYKHFKESNFKSLDFIKSFDALIWMWLLAFVLVKVIEYRTRLTEQEKNHIERGKELEIKQAQLETVHEMVRALQHEINNPLTIVKLYLTKIEKSARGLPYLSNDITLIRESVDRIAATLREFSSAQDYMTVDSPVGKIAKPINHDDSSRTMDEEGSA